MNATSSRVRWGILGPGDIAKTFAGGVDHSRSGSLVAIATRDPEVEAIYIATPHPFHAAWAIKAAEAGKHVLVEKPMGLTAFEAEAMFHAAMKAGTFMGELDDSIRAFDIRLTPEDVRRLEEG